MKGILEENLLKEGVELLKGVVKDLPSGPAAIVTMAVSVMSIGVYGILNCPEMDNSNKTVE